MKRLIYYLIFLLALVMMMLACSACRSPKTVTYSQATTDSVNLSVKDSSARHLTLTFDSLELWGIPDIRNLENMELGKSQAEPLSRFLSSSIPKFHHAVIYGGKLLCDKTRAMSHDSTSNKTTMNSRTTKIRPSPSSLITPHFSLLILFALAIVLFFLIRLRSSKVLQNTKQGHAVKT